ncbi:Uncharacterized protein dnl_11470 [Desulfonema limicola]|uniref:ISKra4 family transposase n=1 Tax=Desulfonema limicola TaxID=45656 RepID=A0A975GF77_9BACT|nr:ISKra4 family transposase [Desulfonema limicola]QTA78383.1 Uncharacterized protein dnl_06050 [Desulfonema limicola]QTA78900.1 Uncharacterized protein dnl_11470 [Desulfonema limicola]
MKVINIADRTEHIQQASNVEKYISESKAKFNLIISEVVNSKSLEAHKTESMIFKRLLELGLFLLKLYFASQNQGDYGKTIETAQGQAKRGRTSEKTYFSIFGKIKISRYLYHTDNKTFAPLDILLNLPIRCYSYFLSEMFNLLNIKDAYSEGVIFVKKFFGQQVSISASETISGESSSCYEEFYELGKTLKEHEEKKDYTAVSFDGKGVPMIKKEAAKITGRQGKGKKKQKKKESLVGAKYNINANIRTADDVANNLVYPEKKESETENKQEKAQNIRYIASIAKPKKEVMEEIYDEVKNENFSKTPLLCLMDGSLYLWEQLKTVFKDISNKVCILDIIHVLEYIWLIAHMMYKEGSEDAKKYVYKKLKLILEGKISSYIMELQTEMQKKKWKKKSHQEKFKKVITYFKNHREYMKYDEYLAKGYPIGTGVVESACSHVVKDRMEISGARWGINGAESVLRLRSVVKSKDWDSYWEFFTSQVREKDFIADDYNSLNIKEKVCA